jgi:hypothetical protein
MSRIIQVMIRVCLVGGVVLAFMMNGSHPTPAAAQTITPFDLRDHPLYLIASYYNAITLQDYARAYSYWNGHAPGSATYQQFAQGFADVQSVRALARLPIAGGVAAGTVSAEVPVVVLTTLKNGGAQIFAGCFHVVHYDVPVGNPPVTDPNWYLDSAVLQPAVSVDFVQAVNACPYSHVESFPTSAGIKNQYSPVDLISSYYDAIAAHDYARAYSYWPNGTPGQTFTQFAAGFAGTANVGVVVALQFYTGVAAGSIYTDVPLLITATDWGQPQLFVGCIVTRESNVQVGNAATPDPNWRLYSANIYAVNTLDLGVQQVWNVCSTP